MPKRRPAARKTAKRSRTASKVPGISRIDQPSTRTFGWFVRYGYRPTSKGTRPKFTAFFGDATHGGKAKAMKAAMKWLKQVLKTGRPTKRK